ncbi:hypothetical protein GCM10023187_24170 [Nibrella viscosa]|uniref:6-phosphogluconate dehydrogenase n=1 Tax=Nibrella viscosa TaxID=1084524 RepID=A0ABP8KGI3_9BACT
MRLGIFFLIFFLFVFGIFWYLTAWSYSDGERAGTVSKFSRRGYVFKTWEGILNVGGFSGETGSLTPQFFEFSVKDDSVAQQINQAVKTGQRITLHYEEKLVRLPWNGDTKYFITGVEFVNNPYQRPYYDGSALPGTQPGSPQQQSPKQQPNRQQAPIDSVLNGSL